jgi:hypothetical protein
MKYALSAASRLTAQQDLKSRKAQAGTICANPASHRLNL